MSALTQTFVGRTAGLAKINATRKVRASNVVLAAANKQQVRNQYIVYENSGISYSSNLLRTAQSGNLS
jgi:hypothetical protein